MEKTVDVLVDLQFGSTGKGALAGFLSARNKYDAVISCNMPNAGHTAYSPEGQKFMHKVLPSGIFSPELTMIGVGPGAVFSIDRLVEEWEGVRAYRDDVTLVIHDAAGILLDSHREIEQNTLSRISSTMQGSAEALISKIRRQEGATAKYHEFELVQRLSEYGPAIVIDQSDWLTALCCHKNILAEGSQGYSLGISSGFYPFCTSRECTPARVISDCSIPIGWVRDIYGSARVHPIRVGNTPDGYSGDWYPDQRELTFEELGQIPELTTVTQRVRRIATFSEIQIKEAMIAASPTHVFLNFCNYSESDARYARDVIDSVAHFYGCGSVAFMGYGPLPTDIKEV